LIALASQFKSAGGAGPACRAITTALIHKQPDLCELLIQESRGKKRMKIEITLW